MERTQEEIIRGQAKRGDLLIRERSEDMEI